MKLICYEGGKPALTVPLPLSVLALPTVRKKILQNKVSRRQMRRIIRAVRSYRRENGSFVLLEILDRNDETVRIIV